MTTAELIEGHHVDQERRGLMPNSIDTRDHLLKMFARYMAPRSMLEAKRDDVEAFLDERRARDGGPICSRTRYAWLSHLHNFFDWALREELSDHDPTARIIRPKLRRALPRPAATDELRVALEAAKPKHRCWLLLAAYMGLRCQEIAGIRREDVLDTEGSLRVVKGKGGVERILPLHPAVAAALAVLPMPRTGWMFTRPQGGPYSPPALSSEFNRFLRGAGVTGSAHTLRHWFGTNLYRQSHDIRMTQEMLGHANIVTTAIYTAFDHREATDAVSAISFASDGGQKTHRDDGFHHRRLTVVEGGLAG